MTLHSKIYFMRADARNTVFSKIDFIDSLMNLLRRFFFMRADARSSSSELNLY